MIWNVCKIWSLDEESAALLLRLVVRCCSPDGKKRFSFEDQQEELSCVADKMRLDGQEDALRTVVASGRAHPAAAARWKVRSLVRWLWQSGLKRPGWTWLLASGRRR